MASPSATLSIVEQARLRKQAAQGDLPKVLFVDDEERILRALAALFRGQYAVTITTDPVHALALVQQERFHVIVSDQRMPQMQGVELLSQARSLAPNSIRVLLTGYADLSAVMASMNEAEVFRYLTKPWLNSELHETLDQAVRAGLALAASDATANGPDSSSHLVSTAAQAQGSRLGASARGEPVLFVERSGHLHRSFLAEPHNDLRPLAATDSDEALNQMAEHEVSVLVVAIDGDDHDNIEFIRHLKVHHPHVTTIVVSDLADSTTVVSLINDARVFRGAFRPVKVGALRLYIKSALRLAEQFRINPAVLKTQEVSAPAQAQAQQALQIASPRSFVQRLKSMRKFFWRRA
jgi:DNA-binding NtrC family response regulator